MTCKKSLNAVKYTYGARTKETTFKSTSRKKTGTDPSRYTKTSHVWKLWQANIASQNLRKLWLLQETTVYCMRSSHDPRHKRRQHLIQELFSRDFHEQVVSADATKIIAHQKDIDAHIQKAAPDFPVAKINKTDLAILRLAIYELLIEQKEPGHVIIDEAVELAKEFGAETSPGFVNGVLSHILSYAKPTNI